MSRRSYRQYCGLARALDVIGDRWNLLIVRQLLVGPARYGELHRGLPGVATNLLVDRLRDLEVAGVVERRSAATGGAIYALTEWGAALRRPIAELIRWSTPLMARGPEGDGFQVEWLALALPALLAGGTGTIGISVDGAVLQVEATSRHVVVGPTDGRELDGVLHADAWTVLGLATGALTVDDARVRIDGDPDAVRAVLEPRRGRRS
jgi:DNA-binding HxlR family transcriptional regulator